MSLKDYYCILSVSKDASAEEIKRAFRQLALRYHPDHNPENIREAEAKFKEINEAYEILGNELKRWQYDRLKSLSGNPRPAMESDLHSSPDQVSLQEMLRRLAEMGIFFSGGCRSGRGCRRQFWQDHQQQWRE
jgi:DnaJ-class molecular chaperone